MREEMRVKENRMYRNEQVRTEIQSFLLALDSYPDRFAKNPDVTFEEHCSTLVAIAEAESRRGE